MIFSHNDFIYSRSLFCYYLYFLFLAWKRFLLLLVFSYKNYYHAILGNTVVRLYSNIIQIYDLYEDVTFCEKSRNAANK